MKTLNLSILALSLALVACGSPEKKIEELAAGINPNGPQPKPPVSGAALDGKWETGCIKNPLVFHGEGKRKIFIAVEGDKMEHNVITYADADCRQPNREQDGARAGSWKYERAGVVELRMPIDNNMSALFYFSAALDGETLKVGELGSLDSAIGETPAVELTKMADSVPQGKITLESGIFAREDGRAGKEISVSTAEVDGAVAQVWTQFVDGTPTAELKCEGDTCKGSNGQFEYVLRIKSAKAFDLSVPAFNVTVSYVKR